jgi:hypothetical protein
VAHLQRHAASTIAGQVSHLAGPCQEAWRGRARRSHRDHARRGGAAAVGNVVAGPASGLHREHGGGEGAAPDNLNGVYPYRGGGSTLRWQNAAGATAVVVGKSCAVVAGGHRGFLQLEGGWKGVRHRST